MMKRVRRGRKRRRPPPHHDHRPGMVELFFKRKKGKASVYIRVQKREVDRETPSPATGDFRVSAERDQRHHGIDTAYGDGALLHFKIGV